MGITKRKRRPSSAEQEQTKGQAQGGTRFSRGQQRTKQKGKKKRISTKQKQTEENVPQRSFKNARRHSL